MNEKDKTIASLRKQLSELQKRCNALEQDNALLSYQLDKIDKKNDGKANTHKVMKQNDEPI
jgi:cell division protein FtsB